MANNLSGISYTNNFSNLDGLSVVQADEIFIDGVPINTDSFIPYNGATSDVNLGTFNFQTLGQVTAKKLALAAFESTIMTSPTTSSIFTADSWGISNTVQISSLGSGSFLSTSYLTINDITNHSTLLTFQSDGIANFANTSVRVSTMATNEYDVVNLSTLTSAVAFIENVNALNYLPYTGATNNLNMGGSTITTLGQINAGTLSITSVANADYTLSVNPYDQLEFTNLSNGSIFKTNGSDLFVTGSVNCATLGATNVEAGTNIYLAKTSVAEWRTTLGMSDEYEILDDAGVMRMRLSKTTGLTVSTLNVTQVPSATPTYALGVNGGGQVVSFAVPTTSGLVPYTGATTTVNLGAQSIYATTARFTGVTSATPSLALGVDASGNLNTFTVPSATNLLPLNNIWTGSNTYNAGIQIAAGSLGVATGSIIKQTATAGSLVQITGGGATNSPYLEFLFGGNSRGYIGNASAVDLDLVAQNGAKLNFYTAGAKRLEIDTAGAVIMPLEFRKVGGNSGTNWFSIRGQDASNSPYIEFWVASVRRCYIGFATTTSMSIMAESGAKLQLGAGGVIAETIDTNGYIGVGTVSPSYKLHVAGGDGNIRAEGAIYCDNYISANPARQIILNDASAVNYITNNTGTKPISLGPGTWANGGYTVISQNQSVNGVGLGLGNSSYPGNNGGRSVLISLAPGVQWGEMIISAATIYTVNYGTTSNYTNGGPWVYISDRRCKREIRPVKTARSLERIMALKPMAYKKIYNTEKTPIPQEVIDADHIGFMAQDVQESNPHCVSHWTDVNEVEDGDDGKRLGITYQDISIHAVGAIQEIVKQSTSQATLVQELKKQNDLLLKQGQEAQRAYDAQQKEIDDLRTYKKLSEERFDKLGSLIEQLLSKK